MADGERPARSRVGVILYVNRSGSTLLSRLLSDAAADLFVFPELHFTLDLLVAQRQGIPIDPDGLARRVLGDLRLPSLGIDAQALRALCLAYGGDLHAFLDAVATCLLGRPPRAIILKLESYVDFVPELDALLDRPVLIHALRDPRGAIRSMLATPVTGKPGFDMARGSLVWAARHWTRYMAAVARLAQGRPVLEARYEMLLADPWPVLAPILQALGVTPDANRGRYIVAAIDVPLHRNVEDRVDPRRAASWRDQLAPRDIGTIERIAGAAMQDRGYAPDRPSLVGQPLPIAARTRHWWAMTRHIGRTGCLYVMDPARRRLLVDRLRLARSARQRPAAP